MLQLIVLLVVVVVEVLLLLLVDVLVTVVSMAALVIAADGHQRRRRRRRRLQFLIMRLYWTTAAVRWQRALTRSTIAPSLSALSVGWWPAGGSWPTSSSGCVAGRTEKRRIKRSVDS